MKYFITLIFFLVASSSWGITLNDINDKPSSLPKNFLIWQFLHQEINASEASEAFYQLEGVNQRFLTDYAAKTDEPEIKYTVNCLNTKATDLLSVSQDDCLMLGLTPAKAVVLTKEEKEAIAQRLHNRFGYTDWLYTLNQESFYTSTQNLTDETLLFRLAGGRYRWDHFNHRVTPEILIELSKNPHFSDIVYLTATDPKMDQLQQSLSTLTLNKHNTPQTNFFLALNALKYGNMSNAIEHLQAAEKHSPVGIDKDKALFWLYKITQDPLYLDKLVQSLDINMYVLYGRELRNLPTENYFTTLPTRENPTSITGVDPFEWKAFAQDLANATPQTAGSLIDRCDGNNSVGVQGYVLEKIYKPYIHNFTMAYDPYMTTLSNDQKALIYALMRQETRFIPGLISHAFALGLMQIMPFNVDAITKTNSLKITTYFDMLQPNYSIAYSVAHLKHLTDKLYNPLLIAYAYNAGIGATKRLLLEDKRFLPAYYEPFLSMELMANNENREYGKRVLANYVIYKTILGEAIKITSLFDNLVQPNRSDYFRATALTSSQAMGQTE
ncbi:MAG: lytic transglycosylase domain-containing protein [Sulfuricurvum sp.]